ncbi:MAG: chromosome partitioning protein ParB, partial [Clostridia bacterium]|nr:chromosome partitioning protein ParB [Clostridia bacterium]
MAVKKGLGKGLDSLIAPKEGAKAATAAPAAPSDALQEAIYMDINKVEPNRDQPRKKFDEDALLELSESLK